MIASRRSVQSAQNLFKILLSSMRKYSAGITDPVVIDEKDYIKLDIHGETLHYPSVWLRDNCQCKQCFHPSARSRVIDWSTFNTNSKPRDVVKDENSVQVTWDDGHQSRFNINWLKFRGFTEKHQKHYTDTFYKPVKKTWHGDDFAKIISRHDYDGVLNDERQLYKWLHDLSTYGFALIQKTPHSETALNKVIEKIGFVKETHYGTNFVVQHVNNTSNVAYLSSNLQMHVDLPYYEYCPGVNMLHCLVQTLSEGGENLLSDCHYTANFIKTNHPEQYKLLTQIEVEWSDIGVEHGNEFYKLYRSPVICLDKYGVITRINFSIPQRGSNFPCPLELVKPWYEAHSLFYRLNMEFAAKFKTKSGEILTFDNIRLLHGRNQYKDKNENVRKLIGAYVDWDEIYSRFRCLHVKLYEGDGIM